MALLDQAPRSASATALEDSVLLEIDQEDFFEVLASNPEIMRGIMRLLSRRLRDASLRLAGTP
jgi:CRP-like cAMP-binding protein